MKIEKKTVEITYFICSCGEKYMDQSSAENCEKKHSCKHDEFYFNFYVGTYEEICMDKICKTCNFELDTIRMDEEVISASPVLLENIFELLKTLVRK